MKRIARLLLCLGVLLCCCGCIGTRDMSGCWVCEQEGAYYFELDADGSCYMFSADDQAVSWGTYTVTSSGIAFSLDTGSFTWVEQEDHTMLFEANGVQMRYMRRK